MGFLWSLRESMNWVIENLACVRVEVKDWEQNGRLEKGC